MQAILHMDSAIQLGREKHTTLFPEEATVFSGKSKHLEKH